jgi:NADH-quinone oxidoreductase subunit L
MANMYAFSTALAGFLLATLIYGLRVLDPAEVRKHFAPIYTFLRNKWYFDEIYDFLFMRPTHLVAAIIAWIDRNIIDRIIDGLAKTVLVASKYDDWFDRLFVDGLVNGMARVTYSVADGLRGLQTGRVRQYVMFVVVATVALFVLVSFYR